MKINNQYSTYRGAYQSQIGQETSEKGKRKVKKDPVELDLSNASKQIRLSEQTEEIDFSKKIANIKQAILDGTYRVSSEEIADKMFDNL